MVMKKCMVVFVFLLVFSARFMCVNGQRLNG